MDPRELERRLAAMAAQIAKLQEHVGNLTVRAPKPTTPLPVVRVQVTAVDPNGNTTLLLVRRYDGVAMTGAAFPIAKTENHAVGDETYVYQPVGGVEGDPTYDPPGSEAAGPVTWQEVGGGSIPPPTQKYQVYTPVDESLV